MWSVPVRFVVMWAPLLAVTIGSGIYLYECADTILSPGTGFTMDYGTPAGVLKIECKSYSISLFQQSVVVGDLSVKRTDGSVIAKIPQLVARGIAIDDGLSPKVQLRDAELWISRDAKGEFEILKYFPPSEKSESQQSWQISVKDSQIHFMDYTVPGGAANDIRVASANFAGMGDLTEGTAQVAVPGLATGLVNFKKFPHETKVYGKNISAKLAPALARLRAGSEKKLIASLDPLKLASGDAKGEFVLLIPEKGKTRFQSNLTAGVSAPQWKEYKADHVEFKGSVSETGLAGTAKVRYLGATADANGALTYEPITAFAGSIKVAGVTPKHLASLKLKVPKEVSFGSASSEGYLTFEKGLVGWRGKSTVNAPVAYGLKTPRIDANVELSNNQLLATIQPVIVGNTLVQGNLGVNLKTKAILGTISTPNVRAQDFSKWLPTNVLASRAQLTGVIDGTISKPNVIVKGSIDPRIKLSDRTLAFNKADLVLRFDGSKFILDRLTMNDKSGSLYASGEIDLKKGLSVRVVGNSVDLASLVKETSGKVDIQGQVFGKLNDPQYTGKVQAYNVGYTGISGTVLAIASDFTGNSKGIKLKDIEAMKEASQISGALDIGFADQKLSGMFAVSGIDIHDLYDGPVGGVLDINDISVGGTFSAPRVEGKFEASKIIAYNFLADSAKGRITYDGEKLKVTEGTAQFAGGTVSDLSADFKPNTKSGNIAGKFEKVNLQEVSQSIMKESTTPDGESKRLSSDFSIRGTSSGKFDLGIVDGKFASVTSTGHVDDVRFNRVFLGAGDWSAGFNGDRWSADAMIGSLDKYFRVDGGEYYPATGQIGGEVLSYQIPVQEIITAVEPNLTMSTESLNRLKLVTGKLDSLVQFSGTLENPTVEIPDLQLTQLKLGSEDLGSFSVKGTYAANAVNFREGLLEGPKLTKFGLPYIGLVTIPSNLAVPDGTAKIAGKISANSDLDITGSIFGFPASKFSALAPSLSNVDLFVKQADFTLKGTSQEPVFASSLHVSAGMLSPDGKKVKTGLLASRLLIDGNVSATPSTVGGVRSTKVDATGTFNLNSISGTLGSHIFLDPEFGVDKKAPVDIEVKLDGERDVTDFFKDIDGIVLGAGGAKLKGGLTVKNTIENPTIAGGFDLNADSVRYSKIEQLIGRPIDTTLKDLFASLKIENDPKHGYVVRTQASTASNYSRVDPTVKDEGYLKFDAKVSIDDLVKGTANDDGLDAREILDGTLSIKDLGIYQSFPQNTYVQASISTPDSKPIQLSGSLLRPKIKGDLYFDGVKTVIPTLNATEGTQGTPVIQPEFDLKFFANTPMSVKSSLAEVNAVGSGSIKGTLTNLKADGLLTVESGMLTLPGGRVKLSPDGTLTLRYESGTFLNRAQLIANLHGETSITALKNGTTPERYEVFLDIKGDLLGSDSLTSSSSDQPGELSPNRLELDAYSTPENLGKTRILQLLGRTDIVESFITSGVNTGLETELRNAFASFALPSLFSGITNDIGRGFGLDYFGVDYNAFEQASLSFVKNIGNGFFIQGRRQLYQPLPGQPVAYDLRLVYRPRRGPNALRALSFSLGTDQLRPYKLSVDFSSRVRTRNPAYQTIKLYVPNK